MPRRDGTPPCPSTRTASPPMRPTTHRCRWPGSPESGAASGSPGSAALRAHIALLRRLCVEQRGWIPASEFEDAIAACNLLPGPASTQLAIWCGWHLRRRAGAVVAGVCFIAPGFAIILALSALFLAAHPPPVVSGAAAGAGAAVPAVAVHAAWGLAPASWKRIQTGNAGRTRPARARWIGYAVFGGAAAALIGPYLVLVLIACGMIEVAVRARPTSPVRAVLPLALPATAATGGIAALAWVAFKVGALSYGGGFVIIPLMQHDAVHTYHWMTDSQFLGAVALGQVTPGPVVLTTARRRLRSRRIRRRATRGRGRLQPVLRLRPARRPPLRRAAPQHPGPGVPDRRRPGGHRSDRRSRHPPRPRARTRLAVHLLPVAALWLLAVRRGVVTALLLSAACGAALALAGASVS